MKCAKCGNEVAEGSLFCTHCGTKVEQVAVEAPVEEVVADNSKAAQEETQPVVEEVVAEPVEEVKEAESEPVTAPAPTPAPVPTPAPGAAKPAKKFPVKLAGIAVAIIAVIFIVMNLFKGTAANDKQLVYVKDGEILYMEDMTKEKEPFVICEVDNENQVNLRLTADGKYIYFYDDVNSSGYGNLCRAELSKMTKNEEKNEKNIVEISSSVVQYVILDKSNEVIYRKENGKLIYFDGKKETDLAKNVSNFSLVSGKSGNQYLTYEKFNDDDYKTELYLYNRKTGDEEKLTSDLNYVSARNEDFILYWEAEDNAIYVANVAGENEKIASNVYRLLDYDIDEKAIYYVEKRVETHNVYDYIDDPYAATDEGLTNPSKKDYLVPTTAQEAMSESDYDYYMVRYPQYLSNYYRWLSTDYEVGLKYRREYNYVDGKSVYTYYYYDSYEDQWYALDQAYYDASEAYEAAEDRINLRPKLKEQTVELTLYDLYYVKGTEDPVLVAESIDANSVVADAENQIAIYSKKTVDTVRISIDDIYYASDAKYQVSNAFSYSSGEQVPYYYIVNGGAETELELDDTFSTVNVSGDGKSAVVVTRTEDYDYIYTMYSVSGNGLTKGAEITDEGASGKWLDDAYYYYEDVDSDSYGTLMKFKNGKSEEVLKNVRVGRVYLYEDGNYVTYDYESNGSAYDLEVIPKSGDEIELDSINSYTYIAEDRIVYMEEDTLYVYLGKKEDRKIDRDVNAYRCKGQSYKFL